MAINSSQLFAFAWRHAGRIPESLFRGILAVAAEFSWLQRGRGVQRLERNIHRAVPTLGRNGLRALSRRGMRSYLRYFGEVFTLRELSVDQMTARIRIEGYEHLAPHLAGPRSPILALAHMGNWDLAGAYASAYFCPTVTVAERLEPAQLFEDFTRFRTDLGLEILPLGDPGVFQALLRVARKPGRLIALLADRDLTARGVEVVLWGHQVRVAAGPAALAIASRAPLIPTACYYEKLSGPRRKAAGGPWGIVLEFFPEVGVPPQLSHEEKMRSVTQSWIEAVGACIQQHPEDWHMLQKVFVADLDPQRDAMVRSEIDR